MLDKARYILALICILSYPMAIGWWYVTHPFVKMWRRLGRPLFYTILGIGALLIAALTYLVRGPILSVDFGVNTKLWPPAILLYIISFYVETRCRKYLKARILVGVPELAPDGKGGELLTQGIYGRIRHPRYVAVWLGTIAVALFTNYLAIYIIALAAGPALYLVVVLEERELLDRFGDEYARYMEQVPRFVPRIGSSTS